MRNIPIYPSVLIVLQIRAFPPQTFVRQIQISWPLLFQATAMARTGDTAFLLQLKVVCMVPKFQNFGGKSVANFRNLSQLRLQHETRILYLCVTQQVMSPGTMSSVLFFLLYYIWYYYYYTTIFLLYLVETGTRILFESGISP